VDGPNIQILLRSSSVNRSRRLYLDVFGLAIIRGFGPKDDPDPVFSLSPGLREVAGHAAAVQIPVNCQRPPSSVCGAYCRTVPITCRFDGFTSARPATTTVGTVSFPSERTPSPRDPCGCRLSGNAAGSISSAAAGRGKIRSPAASKCRPRPAPRPPRHLPLLTGRVRLPPSETDGGRLFTRRLRARAQAAGPSQRRPLRPAPQRLSAARPHRNRRLLITAIAPDAAFARWPVRTRVVA
jgi:hypothetical protein